MIAVGATEVEAVYVGTTEVVAVYVGSAEVWAAQNGVPMNMYRSGSTQNIGGSGSWVKITNMAADPDFPDTAITDNNLVVGADGTYDVFAAMSWQTNDGTTHGVRVRLNGTTTVCQTLAADGPHTASASAVSLSAGDVLTLEGSSGSTLYTREFVSFGEGVTYVQITPT